MAGGVGYGDHVHSCLRVSPGGAVEGAQRTLRLTHTNTDMHIRGHTLALITGEVTVISMLTWPTNPTDCLGGDVRIRLRPVCELHRDETAATDCRGARRSRHSVSGPWLVCPPSRNMHPPSIGEFG